MRVELVMKYGHYYHDFIDGIDGSFAGNYDMVEGWGMFFANSVMNWEKQ